MNTNGGCLKIGLGFLLLIIAGILILPALQTPPTPPTIQIVEPYQIRAKILGTKRYRGQNNYWAPVDAIFAWGPATDPKTTEGITFSQSGRWYHFYAPPSKDAALIGHHTANTHLVATNPAERELILSLESGQTYFFEGALVNASFPEGKVMKSSTSRTDRGAGACEVFLLKKATLIPNP